MRPNYLERVVLSGLLTRPTAVPPAAAPPVFPEFQDQDAAAPSIGEAPTAAPDGSDPVAGSGKDLRSARVLRNLPSLREQRESPGPESAREMPLPDLLPVKADRVRNEFPPSVAAPSFPTQATSDVSKIAPANADSPPAEPEGLKWNHPPQTRRTVLRAPAALRASVPPPLAPQSHQHGEPASNFDRTAHAGPGSVVREESRTTVTVRPEFRAEADAATMQAAPTLAAMPGLPSRGPAQPGEVPENDAALRPGSEPLRKEVSRFTPEPRPAPNPEVPTTGSRPRENRITIGGIDVTVTHQAPAPPTSRPRREAGAMISDSITSLLVSRFPLKL